MAWDAGHRTDGSDSKARVVAPRQHWPEMRALILVASAEKKGVSSTAGMQTTVATSALFKTRAETVVPKAMQEMESAIATRDFEKFAKATMRDSNSFHATCMDTDPPIFYLNDVSRASIRAVERINERAGKTVAAYTFDAGPNCVIYYLEENRNIVIEGFGKALEHVDGWRGISDGNVANSVIEGKRDEEDATLQILGKGVTRVIHTSVGEGPVSVEEHLVDAAGKPI